MRRLSTQGWILLARVKSSSGSRFYRVSIRPGGLMGCSCLAWTQRTPRVDCKHIAAIWALANNGFTSESIEFTDAGERWARAGGRLSLSDQHQQQHQEDALIEEQRRDEIGRKIKDGRPVTAGELSGASPDESDDMAIRFSLLELY